MEKIVVVVLLCATFVLQGSCAVFQCYDCFSGNNQKACNDPFNKSMFVARPCRLRSLPSDGSQGVRLYANPEEDKKLINLDGQHYRAAGNYCVKIESKKNSQFFTQRGCTDMGTTVCDNVKQQIIADGGTMEHCSYCEGEGCNFAPSTTSTMAVILLAPVLATLRGLINV